MGVEFLALTTYRAEVERKELGVFQGFLMFVSRQTNITVPVAKLPTQMTSPTPLGRAHEQWLTLLTLLPLVSGEKAKNEWVKMNE